MDDFRDETVSKPSTPSSEGFPFVGKEDHFLCCGTVEDLGLGGIVGGTFIPTTFYNNQFIS